MAATIDGTTGLTAPSGAIFNGIASGTAVASTSGTSIDFTSIPSWVKRITVMLNGVSTNGTSVLQIQVGSGSVLTSGYFATGSFGGTMVAYTSGFGLTNTGAAVWTMTGFMTLSLVGSNAWVVNGGFNRNSGETTANTGGVTLSGTLDRIRITTVNGTDTFDAGSINILYE